MSKAFGLCCQLQTTISTGTSFWGMTNLQSHYFSELRTSPGPMLVTTLTQSWCNWNFFLSERLNSLLLLPEWLRNENGEFVSSRYALAIYSFCLIPKSFAFFLNLGGRNRQPAEQWRICCRPLTPLRRSVCQWAGSYESASLWTSCREIACLCMQTLFALRQGRQRIKLRHSLTALSSIL